MSYVSIFINSINNSANSNHFFICLIYFKAAEKSLKFFRDDQSNAKTEEETELNEIGKSEKVQEMNENESSGLSFSDFSTFHLLFYWTFYFNWLLK